MMKQNLTEICPGDWTGFANQRSGEHPYGSERNRAINVIKTIQFPQIFSNLSRNIA
jgi:hypothetical protein